VTERPRRHDHRHDQKKVISLILFVNMASDCNGLKWSYECICYLFCIVVPDDELVIDALDGFAKCMCGLHPKPEGEDLECFCGDICKMEVSGDYKTLWQWFWMCNNLAYNLEPGETEVPYNIYFKQFQHFYL
jgi:hypothetical protein